MHWKEAGQGYLSESGVWGLIFLGRIEWVRTCTVRLCKMCILQIKFKTVL